MNTDKSKSEICVQIARILRKKSKLFVVKNKQEDDEETAEIIIAKHVQKNLKKKGNQSDCPKEEKLAKKESREVKTEVQDQEEEKEIKYQSCVVDYKHFQPNKNATSFVKKHMDKNGTIKDSVYIEWMNELADKTAR